MTFSGTPSPASAAVDDTEQRPDRHLLARLKPRLELLEGSVVHGASTQYKLGDGAFQPYTAPVTIDQPASALARREQ